VEQEIIKLTRIVLKQNYFQFNCNIYTQTNGMAMRTPTSSVLSVIYLQYLEHSAIFDTLLQHKITGYYRYVYNIILIYDTRHTDIHEVLNQFNKIDSKMQFTLEQEENNAIHFLEITISRTDNII
jgi:DNA integrity scanning protein DisA with diadenylate cyclase activity